jgi:hypothetical protein
VGGRGEGWDTNRVSLLHVIIEINCADHLKDENASLKAQMESRNTVSYDSGTCKRDLVVDGHEPEA